ncbi:hypothetical protein LK533_17100 [Sphingomonas sp. PL-96]|uniref:DUF6624 domain-containing protein n=1 Tax=Sphingomonas sp. PL-96 TaxID=2887201 RepID=UPI001E532A46|nr:DUF6624 domain-containing protein [Sphingomonas sp. PL-96]MCC2978369.1 hypothetical protein [Sphingomonas sp. PL-96]
MVLFGMRSVCLLLLSWLLVGTAPPLPDALKPYVHEGRFDPGDYGWMRGRFEDARPADKEATAAISAWLDACFMTDMAETRAELRAMGIADPKLERGAFRDLLCAQVASAPYPIDLHSFSKFEQAVSTGRPVAESYLAATRAAEQAGGAKGPSLRDALLARPLREQMLRLGLGWGEGDMQNVPPLPSDTRAVVVSRFAVALAETDRSNTQWLKKIIADRGWPKASEIGQDGAREAWLLVQHADADPAFQLKALRLMQPLLATGDVSKRNYAYLHDRVMLKLIGKQRYATQVTCENGKRIPLPLEDPEHLDRLRAEVGLEPLPTYMDQIRESAGECPRSVPAD